MTNADKIRHMSDPELSEFMMRCERQEVPYYGECKTCVLRPCDECRLNWLRQDPDAYTEDPDMFGIILKTVDLLFSGESMYKRATLAGEAYKQIKGEE